MLSKLISGLLFQLLTAAVLVAGLIVTGLIIDILPVLSRFGDLFLYMWEEITSYYGIVYYLDMAVNAVRGLLMAYFSICVGQLFNKHKVWGAIGTYLGLVIVLELFVGIAGLIMGGASGSLLWLASLTGGSWWNLIFKAAQAGVYFFLGAWILEKKANLE